MIEVSTQPIPNQTFRIVLAGQNCFITLRTLAGQLYFSLSIDGKSITNSTICRNGSYLVLFKYLGFVGNLMFIDSQGELDPTYDGLGSRYSLIYFEGSEIV